MSLFTRSKTYESTLVKEDFSSLVSERIKNNSHYRGETRLDGFNVVTHGRHHLPIRLKAWFEPMNSGACLHLQVTPIWHPFLMLLPAYALCLYGLFADQFYLNGRQVSYMTQLLAMLGLAAAVTAVVSILTIAALFNARQAIESDLGLQET